MVKRSGAQVGDDVWVTGTIGDSYLGLQNILGHALKPTPSSEQLWHWEEAYLRPEPRLLMRKILREYASASLDVSDGFLADAAHLASASGVTLALCIDDVPISKASRAWLSGQAEALNAYEALISGGDDYEILFTAHPKHKDDLLRQVKALGQKITKVGRVVTSQKHPLQTEYKGKTVTFKKTGYKHNIL